MGARDRFHGHSTQDEIKDVFLQAGIDCGVPATIDASVDRQDLTSPEIQARVVEASMSIA